jgi:hypothetical protein
MLEILATYATDTPAVERLENDTVRVIIHMGHSTVDIVDACMEDLSFDELNELIDIWGNPECKREYVDVPEGLLVRKILGA